MQVWKVLCELSKYQIMYFTQTTHPNIKLPQMLWNTQFSEHYRTVYIFTPNISAFQGHLPANYHAEWTNTHFHAVCLFYVKWPNTLVFHTDITMSYYKDYWGYLKLYFDTNTVATTYSIVYIHNINTSRMPLPISTN
jgi:hypothetical protein